MSGQFDVEPVRLSIRITPFKLRSNIGEDMRIMSQVVRPGRVAHLRRIV